MTMTSLLGPNPLSHPEGTFMLDEMELKMQPLSRHEM